MDQVEINRMIQCYRSPNTVVSFYKLPKLNDYGRLVMDEKGMWYKVFVIFLIGQPIKKTSIRQMREFSYLNIKALSFDDLNFFKSLASSI